jgi:putative membrane protein
MNRVTRTLSLALLVPALLAACAKDDADTAAVTTDTASVAAPAPAPAPAAAAATVSDAQIAAIVLAANSTDSAGGVLASTHATNPKVKAFGQRMSTDHGGVNGQAVALATRLGVTPEENPTSRQLTQGGEQTRQQLSSLTGAAFDRGYIDAEVEYHDTVLQAIDNTLIPSAQNAELKALLTQVRPAIASHLEMARALQTELQGN